MIYVSIMFVLAQLRSASKQHRRQPHDTGVAIGGGPRFGAWLDKPRLRHILDTAELGNEIIVGRFGRNHCEKISFGTKIQRKCRKYIVHHCSVSDVSDCRMSLRSCSAFWSSVISPFRSPQTKTWRGYCSCSCYSLLQVLGAESHTFLDLHKFCTSAASMHSCFATSTTSSMTLSPGRMLCLVQSWKRHERMKQFGDLQPIPTYSSINISDISLQKSALISGLDDCWSCSNLWW